MTKNAKYYIEKLNMLAHPEGGFFAETYRSDEIISKDHLPDKYSSDRCASTAIYFLIESGNPSKFHRLTQDEIWHFHDGDDLEMIFLKDGKMSSIMLGRGDDASFHVVIPAGTWMGARINKPNSFGLVGCTVAPGFEFEDFELANREILLKEYPNLENTINELT